MQYGNKFNKDFKNGTHKKKLKTKFSVFLLYSQIHVTVTTVNFRTSASPPKEIPYPLVISLSSPHCFPQAWATTNLLFVSTDFPVLNISCE